MDDALAQSVDGYMSRYILVLILVVMDDALAPECPTGSGKTIIGLNPCCNG